MRAIKILATVCAVCVSFALATSVFAQDDLDNLLNDLEGEAKKKEAKPAEVKPAEAKPAEKPAEPAPVAEAKPAEKPAEPAPVAEAKPAENPHLRLTT